MSVRRGRVAIRIIPFVRMIALTPLLLLTTCILFPLGGWPTPGMSGESSPMDRSLKDYRIGFHVHCYLSHDSDGEIKEIADAANRVGIDVIVLNDHYRTGSGIISQSPRGMIDGILFIPGIEFRGRGGSILSFDLKDELLEEDLSSRLTEIEGQGGLSVFGHVEAIRDWDFEPVCGFEVYNLHAEFKAHNPATVLWRAMARLPDSFFESMIRYPETNLRKWDRLLASGRRLTPLAGHDAHANIRVFGPLGGTIGTYQEILRLFSTHVLAEDLTALSIARAIRLGRTYIVFDFLGNASGFSMSYGAGDTSPGSHAILGDEATYDSEHRLQISLPVRERDRIQLVVMRDGQQLLTSQDDLHMALPGPGIYRAEIYLDHRIWVISAPIYLR